jgi:tetratricopeptide (TPR) repeat protein
MNPHFDDRVRRIIPRWRDAATTARLGELGSLKREGRRFSAAPLREKLADWIAEPSLFVATDIVGTALLTRGEDSEGIVSDAAQAILGRESGATATARRAAERVLHGAPSQEFSTFVMTRVDIHRRIHDLRRALSSDPRNGIAWVDLAYLYTLVGQSPQAGEAMLMALRLAPESRHVLRSATRFYVHNDAKDAALWLLRHSDRTQFDPWLVAAEIGVAGLIGTGSKFAKTGLALASSGSFSARDVTEMAAAIGTLETEHGNRRKAKRLFEISLEDPNDNVLAQAAWAARATQVVNVDPANLNVPFSFEARARINFRNRNFRESLRESEAWFNDQRFSVGAAAYTSYVAAVVLAQHEQAITVLKEALVANPDDWTLRNNLAFSLASLGRVEEAKEEFRPLTEENDSAPRRGVWLATSGLLEFRSGYPAKGQQLYNEAIDVFEKERLTTLRALAAVFKAREELHARLDTAPAAVEQAREFVSKAQSPELETLITQLDDGKPEQLSLPVH